MDISKPHTGQIAVNDRIPRNISASAPGCLIRPAWLINTVPAPGDPDHQATSILTEGGRLHSGHRARTSIS